jgi:hypothetical protein
MRYACDADDGAITNTPHHNFRCKIGFRNLGTAGSIAGLINPFGDQMWRGIKSTKQLLGVVNFIHYEYGHESQVAIFTKNLVMQQTLSIKDLS